MRHNALAIDVVIPAHDAARDIRTCLAPLVAMRKAGEIRQIIVVNDASNDATADYAAAAGADHVITLTTGLGPGGARNCGVEASDAEILWFVDADVVVHDDAGQILHGQLARPDVPDALFGAYGLAPIAENFLSQYKNLIHHRTHQAHAGPATTFWTGCGAVSRSAFEAVSGFDAERYQRIGMEDVDFGYRLRAAGYAIELIAEWQCEHRKRWTLLNLLTVEIFHRALPWSRLILAHRDAPAGLNIDRGERIRAFLAGAFVLSLILVMVGAIASGWLVGLTGLLLFANRGLLRFFYRHRGPLFAARAVVFHQIYYLYASATFVYAVGEHRAHHTRRRVTRWFVR